MTVAVRAPARASLRLCLAVAAAAAVLLPRPAAARADAEEMVAQARQAMIRLDYDRAIRLLERAEEAGESDRERLIVIYRYLAESRAALGDGEAAETEFRRLLALDPGADLPSGSSPKVTAPFDAARDYMRRRALLIACERDGKGAALIVQSDPLALVAAGGLIASDGSLLARARRRSARGRVALAAPPGAPADVACAALDRHGNQLARAAVGATSEGTGKGAGDTLDPTSILPPTDGRTRPRPRVASSDTGARSAATVAVSRTPEREPPPIYARWWLWGSGALVAAGATAFFAVQLQADEDDWRAIKRASQEHTYAEALAVQDRGERHALYANIATMTSAALAAVSIGLLVREAVRDDDEPTAQIGAAPLPGGGGAATIRVSF